MKTRFKLRGGLIIFESENFPLLISDSSKTSYYLC